MNVRSSITITISVVFVTLMVTGILLYALPWNYFVGATHVWASICFMIGTIWHFKNNFKVYLSHIKQKVGKKTFAGCGIGVFVLAAGLMLGVPPFSSIMDLGKELKSSGQPVTFEYTLVDLSGEEKYPKLNLFLKSGSAYVSEPQPAFWGFTYTTVPQVAVWMETLDGEYIDTLYVTGKVSSSNFGETEEGITRRPEALPYWSHRRGIQEEDGYYTPVQNNSDLDGITGATPQSDSLISMSAPRMGEYRLLVEVNRSYDFNEFYSKDRFPNDPIYSGDGSSGQPSLIYAVTIDSNVSEKYLLKLVGHGHHSGADGNLYTDLSKITTAKNILSYIVAEVE